MRASVPVWLFIVAPLLVVACLLPPGCRDDTSSAGQPAATGWSTTQTDAVSPAPRLDDMYLSYHRAFVQQARAGSIDLLFIGDSITAGWTTTGEAIWQDQYARLNAANFGIPGDQTQWTLWRLQQGELAGIKPRVVVLMIGTNNIKGGPTQMKAEQVARGVDAVVDLIRAELPESRILLLSILPRQFEQHDWIASEIVDTNRRLADIGERKQVTYLDISAAFVNEQGGLRDELFHTDHLHLSEAGYRVWADAMAPALRRLLTSSTAETSR